MAPRSGGKNKQKKNNVRGSIIGLRGKDNIFSPIQWKSAEISRKCSSFKSEELFALDFGASQMCYLAEMHQRVIEVSSAHHR